MNETVLNTLIVAAGGVLAWLAIWTLWFTDRGRQRVWRKIKCFCGKHASGPVKGEVGGRNVQRCMYCDRITYEYSVTKQSIRRKI